MKWLNLLRIISCFIGRFVTKTVVILIEMLLLIFVVALFDYMSFYSTGFVINPIDGWLFSLLSPPDDYFSDLSQVRITDYRDEYCLQFSPKYAGCHALAIELTPPLEIGVMAETDMLELDISINSKTQLHVKGETVDSHVWQNTRTLVDLWQFEVSKDISRRQSCEVKIRFGKGLIQFLKKYPRSRLVVYKRSDE